MKLLKRYLLMALGTLCVGLAIVGIILPLLPTTPWVLVAAYCFAKAEPKWEKKLLEHKTFGPLIIAWRDRQAIPRLAKWAAAIMLVISAVVAWFRLPPVYAWIPGFVAAIVGYWIWTRPDQ